MDYHKMLFEKDEMSQTVPTGTYCTDAYSDYADSFDLSLLQSDGEVPLSPQSTYVAQQPQYTSFDYIPTTIYHDQPMKIEKNWIDSNNTVPKLIDNISSISSTISQSLLLQQLQNQYQFYPSPQPSPPQDGFTSIFPPSPSPVAEQNFQKFPIKQEFHVLPPSPPESSGAPSPFSDIKIESETDNEAFLDINTLLEKSLKDLEDKKVLFQPQLHSVQQIQSHIQSHTQLQIQSPQQPQQQHQPQDHQLLREYLQDTSFQKKHNLKPLALESLIGGLSVRSDIEPVISLALEHAKRDAQAMCASLKISPDPTQWTTSQVHAWIRSTTEQFKLPHIEDLERKFPEDGAALTCFTEEEFVRRAPEAGSTIHAQLEVWKLACSENFPSALMSPSDPTTSTWSSEQISNMDNSDDEDEEMPIASASNISPSIVTKTGRTGSSHIHLWQFLKELLASPQTHGTAIRWLDRSKGVFKIEDSVRVAKLWGRRKNRPAMNYDKLSRSIRQYYKKGIMKKTERSQRLVYQFCHPYSL